MGSREETLQGWASKGLNGRARIVRILRLQERREVVQYANNGHAQLPDEVDQRDPACKIWNHVRQSYVCKRPLLSHHVCFDHISRRHARLPNNYQYPSQQLNPFPYPEQELHNSRHGNIRQDASPPTGHGVRGIRHHRASREDPPRPPNGRPT